MTNNKKIFGFHLEKLKQWFLYWLALGIGFFVLVFLVSCAWIAVDVKERCMMAQSRYEGDCVEALIQVVDGDINSYQERNNAIWALGQLGDERAKEVLEKYYTGNIPEREPYDQGISQYELKKAIKLVNGGTNITHFIWKPEQVIKNN